MKLYHMVSTFVFSIIWKKGGAVTDCPLSLATFWKKSNKTRLLLSRLYGISFQHYPCNVGTDSVPGLAVADPTIMKDV